MWSVAFSSEVVTEEWRMSVEVEILLDFWEIVGDFSFDEGVFWGEHPISKPLINRTININFSLAICEFSFLQFNTWYWSNNSNICKIVSVFCPVTYFLIVVELLY